MPGPLVHVGATILCPHGGLANIISSNARVLVNGMPVATVADQFMIAACAFNVAGVPQPCLLIQWMVPAVRVLVNGQPPILQTSTGLCMAVTGAPAGPPVPAVVQPRVIGT